MNRYIGKTLILGFSRKIIYEYVCRRLNQDFFYYYCTFLAKCVLYIYSYKKVKAIVVISFPSPQPKMTNFIKCKTFWNIPRSMLDPINCCQTGKFFLFFCSPTPICHKLWVTLPEAIAQLNTNVKCPRHSICKCWNVQRLPMPISHQIRVSVCANRRYIPMAKAIGKVFGIFALSGQTFF